MLGWKISYKKINNNDDRRRKMKKKKEVPQGDHINILDEIPFSDQMLYVPTPFPSFELPRLTELKGLDLLRRKTRSIHCSSSRYI